MPAAEPASAVSPAAQPLQGAIQPGDGQQQAAAQAASQPELGQENVELGGQGVGGSGSAARGPERVRPLSGMVPKGLAAAAQVSCSKAVDNFVKKIGIKPSKWRVANGKWFTVLAYHLKKSLKIKDICKFVSFCFQVKYAKDVGANLWKTWRRSAARKGF